MRANLDASELPHGDCVLVPAPREDNRATGLSCQARALELQPITWLGDATEIARCDAGARACPCLRPFQLDARARVEVRLLSSHGRLAISAARARWGKSRVQRGEQAIKHLLLTPFGCDSSSPTSRFTSIATFKPQRASSRSIIDGVEEYFGHRSRARYGAVHATYARSHSDCGRGYPVPAFAPDRQSMRSHGGGAFEDQQRRCDAHRDRQRVVSRYDRRKAVAISRLSARPAKSSASFSVIQRISTGASSSEKSIW